MIAGNSKKKLTALEIQIQNILEKLSLDASRISWEMENNEGDPIEVIKENHWKLRQHMQQISHLKSRIKRENNQ